MIKDTLHIKRETSSKKDGLLVVCKIKKGNVQNSYILPRHKKKKKIGFHQLNSNTIIERYKDTFIKEFYNDVSQYQFTTIEALNDFIKKIKGIYLSAYTAIKQNNYLDRELSRFIFDYENVEGLFEAKKEEKTNQLITIFKQELDLYLTKYGYLTKHLKGHIKCVMGFDKIKNYVDPRLFYKIIDDAILEHNLKEFEKQKDLLYPCIVKLYNSSINKVLSEINAIIYNFDSDDIEVITKKYLNCSVSQLVQEKKNNLFKDDDISPDSFKRDLMKLNTLDLNIFFLEKYKKLYKAIISNEFDAEFHDILKEYSQIQTKVNFRQELRNDIEKRAIRLFHFTREENIKNILKYGVLSVYQLKQRNLDFYNNDSDRMDNKLNCICCSIGFPNVYLLHAYHSRTLSDYLILELKKELLLDKEYFFCSKNAASNFGNDVNLLSNIKDFDNLFRCKDDNEPINPQSEILVREQIECKYIECIHVYSKYEYALYSKLYPNYKFVISPELFTYRKVM